MIISVEVLFFLFFKLKSAYEMRISDWSSDVCSSDLLAGYRPDRDTAPLQLRIHGWIERFLLCARLYIVAACAARRQVVVAVAHAVAVAAFGVDPRVLVGAVDHAH